MSCTVEDFDKFYESVRDNVHLITMEECGELIQVLSKIHRYTMADLDTYRESLIEEMADVLICIDLLVNRFHIADLELMNMYDTKMKRNLDRLSGQEDA